MRTSDGQNTYIVSHHSKLYTLTKQYVQKCSQIVLGHPAGFVIATVIFLFLWVRVSQLETETNREISVEWFRCFWISFSTFHVNISINFCYIELVITTGLKCVTRALNVILRVKRELCFHIQKCTLSGCSKVKRMCRVRYRSKSQVSQVLLLCMLGISCVVNMPVQFSSIICCKFDETAIDLSFEKGKLAIKNTVKETRKDSMRLLYPDRHVIFFDQPPGILLQKKTFVKLKTDAPKITVGLDWSERTHLVLAHSSNNYHTSIEETLPGVCVVIRNCGFRTYVTYILWDARF